MKNDNGNFANDDDFGDDNDEGWTTDVSKEAVKKRMKVKFNKMLFQAQNVIF